jgi:hypothetical protein
MTEQSPRSGRLSRDPKPEDPDLARLLDEMLALSALLPHVEEAETAEDRAAA